MKDADDSRDRLDVPLIWDARQASAAAERPPRPGSQDHWPRWRLVPAALADLGAVLTAIALAGFVAWWRGASLTAPQLVVAGAAGLVTASVLAVALLWAWRATLGMMLMGGCFSRALPLSRAWGFWLVWLLLLPGAGLPLLVGSPRECLAERLAGSGLSSRSSLAGA